MTRRQVRSAAAALLGSAALALLLPLATAGQALAASPVCSSATHPALAAKLSNDISAALRNRTDTVALTVWDQRTGVSCAVHPNRHFDSASAVKATIMAAVLRRAQEQHRGLEGWEKARLHSMITYSDNDSASALWRSLGTSRFSAFLRLAGMSDTEPGHGDYWGLTQITARDEMRLLDVLTDRQDVLSAEWKAYGLRLMAHVTPSQRWGTPYGAPDTVVSHNKNGWLPRATRGWRVHSLGVFTGGGRDYRMAVLTDRNGSMGYGIETIQRVAEAVHHTLGSADPAPEPARGGAHHGGHGGHGKRSTHGGHAKHSKHVAPKQAKPMEPSTQTEHSGGAQHHEP